VGQGQTAGDVRVGLAISMAEVAFKCLVPLSAVELSTLPCKPRRWRPVERGYRVMAIPPGLGRCHAGQVVAAACGADKEGQG